METPSSILTWRIPWTGPWRATVHEVTMSQHNKATEHTHMHRCKGSLFMADVSNKLSAVSVNKPNCYTLEIEKHLDGHVSCI